MASKRCISCLRTLQIRSRPIYQKAPRPTTSRQILTSPILYSPPSSQPLSTSPATPSTNEAGELSAESENQPEKSRTRITSAYAAYVATTEIYKLCSQHADYSIPQAADPNAEIPETEDGEDLGIGEGWWFNEIGLKPTFSTWSQVTMLHIYLFTVRLRALPHPASKTFQQHLLDHYFYDAESRMTLNHRMAARATRNKYLKELFLQWRGLMAAYDEGIAKNDDAVLAAAVWRNVFKADEDVDVGKLALTVSYVRSSLRRLGMVGDEQLAEGRCGLGEPGEEAGVVGRRSGGFGGLFEKVGAEKAEGIKGKR